MVCPAPPTPNTMRLLPLSDKLSPKTQSETGSTGGLKQVVLTRVLAFQPMVISGLTGIPWIASNPIAYPALEVMHIFGIALLLGNLVLVELRVWGVAAELPIKPLARVALRLSVGGFALIAVSGLLMFASQPGELISNRTFLIKMVLIQLAGVNAACFHARDGLSRADTTARVQTLISTALWLSVMICGRWIAYR